MCDTTVYVWVLTEGTYVCAGVGAHPYREDGVVTAQARRRDRKEAPLLHTAQCRSEPCCLKPVLDKEEEIRNDECVLSLILLKPFYYMYEGKMLPLLLSLMRWLAYSAISHIICRKYTGFLATVWPKGKLWAHTWNLKRHTQRLKYTKTENGNEPCL